MYVCQAPRSIGIIKSGWTRLRRGTSLEQILVHRRGSYFYAMAYTKFVTWLTVVYLALGALLGFITANALDSDLAGVLVGSMAVGVSAAMWIFYKAMLWLFQREARQAVEVGKEGIRETRGGREYAFIPWPGATEIEFAATVVAGGSLRVKGKFSEIAISNVDLAITAPVTIREMHRALGQTARLRTLFDEIRRAAPQAKIRLNRLARKRMKNQATAELL
jgi:hypothetical protein